MRRIGSSRLHRSILAVVIAVVVALPVAFVVVALTSSSSAPSGPESNPGITLSTVRADVVLEVPFAGSTVSVVVNTTIAGNHSTPFAEPLIAQYRPTGNGSVGAFSSYYGTFAVASVNVTEQSQEVNVSLTVGYNSTVHATTVSTMEYDGIADSPHYPLDVIVPMVLGASPQYAPSMNMTATNGATDCPDLGGSWAGNSDTCILGVPTLVTNLTIEQGVTLVSDEFLADRGNSISAFTNYGTVVDTGILVAGLENHAVYDNQGTLVIGPGETFTNSGGFSNAGSIINDGGVINNTGAINNRGTIINAGGVALRYNGTINNAGTINNYGGTMNNYGNLTNSNGGTISNGGYLNNFGGTISNAGTINNYGGIFTNRGSIHNSGTLNNNYGVIYNAGKMDGNQPIGGTVFNF